MGQGTESCNGYDIEYNPYFEHENLGMGIWTQKNGTLIKVTDMSDRHIKNAKRLCENLRDTSTFTDDAESWQAWIDIFKEELFTRGTSTKVSTKYTHPSKIKQTRGTKIKLVCHCGNPYSPRLADLKRGYGKSCSKRCAAIKRDYGRPDPVCAETGITLNKLIKEML